MFDFDFVTSDTHFGHVNIIKYESRPFTSVGQMNGELIRRWNRTVGKTDIVVHLGDLALGKIEQTIPMTAALNGQRFLIPGNHDRVSSANQGGRNIERFRPLYEAAGWTILDEVVEAQLDDHSLLLSHYPYAGDSHDKSAEGPDRYAQVRPVDRGLPLVHGHVHHKGSRHSRQFHVGVDVQDFTPVSRERVIAWLDTI